MFYIYNRIIKLYLVVVLILLTNSVLCEQYVIVDRANGDRLTGRWIGATDTHFDIEYNGQILKFQLVGNTLSFISDVANTPDQQATKYYRNGLNLLDIELPDSAKSAFELAIQESPKYADAHYQLGLLNNIEGNIQKALIHFKSVLLIDAQKHNLVPLLQEIAENAISAEDYTQAVNAFQLIIKHYPEHKSIAKISYQTGFLLVEKLEDPTAALDLLEKTAGQFSNLDEYEKALYLIGVLQANAGDLETALRTLKNFVNIYQDSEWVNHAIIKQATIYLKLGNRKNAVNIANFFLRQNPDDVTLVEQAKNIISESTWNIFTKDLPDPSIQAIAVDETSLWIGTPKGIAQFETSGRGEWKIVEGVAWMINTHNPTIPDVRAIAVNPSGVWVGTRNQGVIQYNKITNKVENYPIADGITWIRDIEMDSKEIWFATDQGVVQQIIENGVQYRHYGNDPVPNDIYSIGLSPDTVWVGTSGNNIAVYNREEGTWTPQYYIDITEETQIVNFDVVEGKMLFSWYNEADRNNGFFSIKWDGTDIRSSSIYEGKESNDELDKIYVTGYGDPSQLGIENGEQNTQSQILWIADNEYIYIYNPTNDEYPGSIGYPNTILEDLSVQCIAVEENRAWIGTTKGMLMIEKDKVLQISE